MDNIELPTNKMAIKLNLIMYIKIRLILDLHLLKTKIFLRNFEAAINTPNTSTISVHDDLTAKNELEQILTRNESTIKLK